MNEQIEMPELIEKLTAGVGDRELAAQVLVLAAKVFAIKHAALDADLTATIEDAVANRGGHLVTQVTTRPDGSDDITLLLAQDIDGERVIQPLIVVPTESPAVN